MDNVKVTKRLRSAAIAHRLGKGYKGACSSLHGHNYFFEISCEINVERLDKYDMVVDFSLLKKVCDDYIQENWDHGTLVSRSDNSLIKFLTEEDQKFFIIDSETVNPWNTTAEFMSCHLALKFWVLLKNTNNFLEKVTVRVWETEDSVAEYTVGDEE